MGNKLNTGFLFIHEAYGVYFIIVWDGILAFLYCCGLSDDMCRSQKVRTIVISELFVLYVCGRYVKWLNKLFLSSSAPADDRQQPTPNITTNTTNLPAYPSAWQKTTTLKQPRGNRSFRLSAPALELRCPLNCVGLID